MADQDCEVNDEYEVQSSIRPSQMKTLDGREPTSVREPYRGRSESPAEAPVRRGRRLSDDGLSGLQANPIPTTKASVARSDSGGLPPLKQQQAVIPELGPRADDSLLKQAPIDLMPMDMSVGTAEDVSVREPSMRNLNLVNEHIIALKQEPEPEPAIQVGISKYRRARSRSPTRSMNIERVEKVKEELQQSFSSVGSFEAIQPAVEEGQQPPSKEYVMELEDEEDATILKRKAIRSVMADTSLDQAQRQEKIQDIMTGKLDPSSIVDTGTPTNEYTMDLENEEAATLARRKQIRAVMVDTSLNQRERQTKIQDIMSGKLGGPTSSAKKKAPNLKNPPASSLKKAPQPGLKNPPGRQLKDPPQAERKMAPGRKTAPNSRLKDPPPESARLGFSSVSGPDTRVNRKMSRGTTSASSALPRDLGRALRGAAKLDSSESEIMHASFHSHDSGNKKMPAKSHADLLDSKMSPTGHRKMTAVATTAAAAAPLLGDNEAKSGGSTIAAGGGSRVARKIRESSDGKLDDSSSKTGRYAGRAALDDSSAHWGRYQRSGAAGRAAAGVGAVASTGGDDPAAKKNKTEAFVKNELFQDDEGMEINTTDYLAQQVRANRESQQKKGKKKDEDDLAAAAGIRKDGAAAVPQAPGAFSVKGGRGWFTGGYRQRNRNESRRGQQVQDADVELVIQDNIDEDDYDCAEKLYAMADKPTICVGICILIFIIAAITIPVTLNANKVAPPTAAPTSARFFIYDEFKEAMVTITDEASFDDPNSAQTKALDWLVYDDELALEPDDPEAVERYIMMVIYFAGGGESWTFSGIEWGEGVDECQWSYVTCEGSSVGALELMDVGMTGTLESEMVHLEALSSLDISRNELGEEKFPPVLLTLTNLNFLYLDDNELRGTVPSEIGILTDLEHLNIGNNEFTGELPIELENLASIRVFDAYLNRLEGPVMDIAMQWPDLTRLDVSNNRFFGTIATQIGSFQNLRALRLDSNDLRGSVPTQLGNVNTLRSLIVARNFRLAGSLPSELAKCTELRTLAISDNKFTGTIPTQYGAAFPDLTTFQASHNEFTGAIPSELGLCTSLEMLLLDSTSLVNQVPPELGNLPLLEQLTLHFTGLTGSMPADICALRQDASLTRLEADCFDLNAQLLCDKPDCCTICH